MPVPVPAADFDCPVDDQFLANNAFDGFLDLYDLDDADIIEADNAAIAAAQNDDL